MTEEPSKGASLSAIRRQSARAGWARTGPVKVAPIIPQTKPRISPKPATTLDQRVIEIADDAIAAYNAVLGKPHGLLPKVTRIGIENRRNDVKRCLTVASRACEELYGDKRITPQFWEQYFGEVAKDDFKSGRIVGGNGHESWTPNFEYLTRPKTMLDVIEKAVARA